MAYSYTNAKGSTYFLHSKDVTFRGGRKQKIYFFAKEIKEGAISSLPDGKMVVESKRTGMPIIKNGEPEFVMEDSDVMVAEDTMVKTKKMVDRETVARPVERIINTDTSETKITQTGAVEVNDETIEPVIEEVVEPVKNIEEKELENDAEVVVREKKKIKLNPLALALLPGQIMVVATAKLVMYAMSKTPKKTPVPEDLPDFEDI